MTVAVARRVRFGRYVLDTVNKTLHLEGDELRLRPRTFDVLTYLVERPGRLVTKEELLSTLWSEVVVTDDALVHCVSEIRQALGDEAQQIVRTVFRRGYIFTIAVTEATDDLAPVATKTGASVTSLGGPPPILPAASASLPLRRGRVSRLALTLLLLAVASSIIYAVSLVRARHVQTPPLSIAVLPFTNQYADPDQEYFADALADDITTDLSSLPQSLVIARNSANTYKGRNIDAPLIGKELGVRYLLEGSVHRMDDQVRLNLRLTDTGRGTQVWAERMDGDRRNLVDLQRRVTDSIARTLHVALVDAEAKRATEERPGNPDAHDLAMRGWALWNRQTPDSVATARELLKRAVALDPGLASAWSTLSATYTADLQNRWMHLRGHSREEWMHLQEQAAEKAYALDVRYIGPSCTAMMFRREPEQALACREKQIAQKPPDPLPYHMAAMAHFYLGESEPVIALEQQAIRISPRDTRLHNFTLTMAAAEFQLGRYGDALQLAEKAVNFRPDFGLSYAFVAAAAVEIGDMDKAHKALTEFRRLQPGYTIKSFQSDSPSDRPAFAAQRDRFYQALRSAGLPD